MGKSLGNTIDPRDLVSRFGPDAVRYYFLKEIEFGKDGDFSEGRFIDIINAHLANTIGKVVILSMERLRYGRPLLVCSSPCLDCKFKTSQSVY